MASGTSNRLLGLILIVALLGAGGRTLWLWLDRPIERVSIHGELHHVNAAYLQSHLSPLIRGETWLSVDLDRIRDEARAIDWIHEARVSRQWPNTLEFDLYEQHPVAWWNDSELLNTDGEPFKIGSITTVGSLPNLAGPPGSGPEVLAYLDKLQRILSPIGMKVTQLRLEPRGAWRFQINDNVWVMLGRNDGNERLKRFIAAWQRDLNQQAARIRYIDLRYPNGIAVAWHGESSIADTPGK